MRDRLTSGMANAGKGVDAFGDRVDTNTRKLRNMGTVMESEGTRIEKAGQRLMQGAAAYLTVDKGSELIQRMIDIRAERQMLEKSFEVLLQSKSDAKRMLQEMVSLAIDSPLELTPIAKGGQTLLSFGVDASKVMNILRQLSDISMGNQQRFESLSLAYAQVQATGRLMGQDLLQLVNAGFNPLKIISEQTGKSMAVLKKEMEDGKISAEMVTGAFAKATSEGGQFYNMTQIQAEGIQGVKSTYHDAIVTMYNDWGQRNEDLIISGYKMATEVVKNYEPILKTLGTIIATYGTYKAALIATHAIEQAQATTRYKMEIEELTKLLPQKQASADADLQAAVASGRLTQAKAEELAAVRAEVAAKLEELRMNQALAQSELATATATHKAALQRALDSKAMVSQREMELSLTKLGGDAAQIELAQKALLEAQEQRHIAVKERKATADALNIARSKASATTTAVETMQTKANTAATIAATRAKNLFVIAGRKVTAVLHAMKAAFMSNPVGMILTGIVAVTTAMSLFSDKTEEAEEDVLGLARASKKAGEEYDSQAAKIKTLQGIIENGNVAYNERRRAIDELKAVIPEYNGQLSEEGTLINNNTAAIKEYLVQLERQIKLKAIQDELEEAYKTQRQQQRTYDTARQKLSGMQTNSAYSQTPIIDVTGWLGMRDIQKAQAEVDKAKTELEATNRIIAELNAEIASTASAADGTGTAVKTYAEQMADAADKVNRLKKELADLVAGKGSEADFAKAIKDKKKELAAAQENYDALRGFDKSTKKAGTDANRQKVEIAERKAQIEEYVLQVSRQIARAEEEIAQAQIDAMEEGVTKEQAQIEFNYRKLIRENTERQAEMVKELQKAERLRWENEHPDYKDKGQVFTPRMTAADLSPEQFLVLKKYTDAANAYKAKADADLLKETLNRYATYEQERARIAKEYDERIALMQSNNGDGKYSGNIEKARREKDRMLAELDASMQASSDLWGRLFDSYSSYTNRQLREIISNAQQVLDYVNGTPEADIQANFGMSAEQLKNLKTNAADLAAAYDALGSKLDALNKRNPFGAMIRNAQLLKKNTADVSKAERDLADAQASGDKLAIKNAKEKLAGLQRQKDLLKGGLKEAAKAAVSYLGDVGDSMQQIGEASGNADLESFGKALSDLSGIAERFISGDIIGGAISAITTGLTAIFSSRAKYRAALKQMRDDQIAFAHEYKMAMSDIRLEAEQATNAFGEDAFVKAIAALKELQANYEGFIALVNKDEGIQASRQGIFGRFNQTKQEIKGITTDLQNIWIQTRHKTWFRSAKGEYLKDLYPELFEGQTELGGFNVEAARALLATNNQLNDEAKRQLQEVLDLYDQWKEAEEQFKEYLDETFGEIGSGLGDAIVDGFKKNGTDAMKSWGQSFSNVLEKLGKQMMQTIFFQKHFDQLQDDLTKIYETYGDDPQTVAKKSQELLGNFFKGMSGTVDQAEAWYRNWAEQAKKYGFDLSGEDEQETETSTQQQSGQAGAFQTMDQDTGTELKGLFTAVQMHVSNIDDKLDEVSGGIYAIGDSLSEIKQNTKDTADRVGELLEKFKAMIRDGLKVK